MKHRVTFLHQRCEHEGEDGVNPNLIKVNTSSVKLEHVCGAKEHRLTLNLSHLPDSVTSIIEQSHELHIRWSSPHVSDASAPLVSRIPPGLHVFFTPQDNSKVDILCSVLKTWFDPELKCQSYEASFTSPTILSTRFSTSATSQLYWYLSSLGRFVSYLQDEICASRNGLCSEKASSLLSASALDIDFDVISRVLVITAFWSKGPQFDGSWSEKITQHQDERIEVGVLQEELSDEPEELSLSGFLTVIGQDSDPKPTRFSFPSRHHRSTSHGGFKAPTFSVHFEHPPNLHPVLHLNMQDISGSKPPMDSCALHAYFTMPSVLFFDRHAFSDVLFLRSHNLVALRSLDGATDLEAPEWAINRWGSAALFELTAPQQIDHDTESVAHTIRIPLHTRYLNPTFGGSRNVTIPYPSVFWACRAESGSKFPVNPFDRRNLGFDGLFGDRTVFYYLEPLAVRSEILSNNGLDKKDKNDLDERLVNTLEIPVLDLKDGAHIQMGTVVVVLFGFLWVLRNLFSSYFNSKQAQQEKSRSKTSS